MKPAGRFDVVIIGGGSAGMSSAVWCDDLGLRSLLIEREESWGGQLNHIHGPITNYLGRQVANGLELLAHFNQSLDARPAVTRVNREVISVDLESRFVLLENDERIDYENLIIATGVRRRRLGVPGETDFQGRGILESGTRDKDTVKGKDVVIVGGGDAAAENAVILSQVAKTVTLVHRRNELSARPEFRHEIDRRDNIQILFDTQVRRFVGDSDVTGVEVIESGRGEGLLPADAVLVRIGVQPNSELFRGTLEMDSHGYVLIDPSCATSASGVFAIGDVASPLAPTLSTAVGMGATAAKAVFRCHVAKPRI